MPRYKTAIIACGTIARVHDGIAAYLEREGFASLEDLPRYLPRD